jgi:hypothetical protein
MLRDPARYDADFYAWTLETAASLRKQAWEQVDWEAVIEEIETLGRSEREQLESRMEVLLRHLLKWVAQPGGRQTGHSWRSTIREQRYRLARLLLRSPSLRPQVASTIAEEYPAAVRLAMDETDLPASAFPPACPWTPAQILDEEFWPETFPEAS